MLGEEEHYSSGKKKRRAAPEPVEEPIEEYPMARIGERPPTPDPETLTEGQRILYMQPHRGVFALKKKVRVREIFWFFSSVVGLFFKIAEIFRFFEFTLY